MYSEVLWILSESQRSSWQNHSI